MSGQTHRDLKQDALLRLFYAAAFYLQLSGTVFVTKDEKSHQFRLEHGAIYKVADAWRYRVKNPVWEQYVLFQKTKGQFHLLLERLGGAIEHQDRSLIEQYNIQLADLQKQLEELQLLDD